jgi:eukaryotic-like serine/threonine-protein kinase
MKQCPTCGREFESPQATFCPADGAPLKELTQQTDPLVGITLDGKYRIEQLIGAGGMGSVYKARHLLLDRFVAVKMMKSDLLKDANTAERFKREAQASARLTHPNAVTVYDFGIGGDGSAYLVMELLRGSSLRDMLKRDHVLSYERAVEVFGKICSAIDSAHEQGIIHRDLKPDNVMVDERTDGSADVKVVDFGIAKFKGPTPDTAHLTGTGMIIGTVHYMSPEQCRGHEIDARSDIYSIGIMLYEAVTGRTPFESHTPSAVIIDHVNTPPPSPRVLRGDLPPAVEQVILDALAKRPEDRPRTAGELARRLANAVPRGGRAADVTEPLSAMPPVSLPYATVGGSFPTSAASAPQTSYVVDSGQRPVPLTSGPHAAAPPKKRSGWTVAFVVVFLLLVVGGSTAVVLVGIFGLAVLSVPEDGAQRGNYNTSPPVKNSPANQNKPSNANASNSNTATVNKNIALPPIPNQEDTGSSEEGEEGEEYEPGTTREMNEAETTEAGTVMAFWLYGIMAKDINTTMESFGDPVEYFSAGEVPKSQVRSSYEKAFAKYDSLQFEIVKFYEATLNEDGTMQLVFDKKWDFTGSQGNTSGKVKELLVFKRIDGSLKIVKIEDLEKY